MDSPQTSTVDAGKASASHDTGFRPHDNGIIKVVPPKREDLQPSYAQILQGETEAEAYGWYGSMSTYYLSPPVSRPH